MSKNRAQQSCLILNYGGFCENFSQNAWNIHAEGVAIRKFACAINLITYKTINITPKRRREWKRKIAKGLTESSSAIFVVVPLGLEPRTPWLWVRCSNQLSYRTCLPEAFAKIILKFVICKCSRCIFSWLRHSNTHVEYNSKCKIIESVWRSNFLESQS